MITNEHLQQLILENELLQVQLADVNMVLSIREEELQLLKKNEADATELRSQLDARLDELYHMQNQIGEKERKVTGVEEREYELQLELTEAARLQEQYNELVKHYTYMQNQLSDLQLHLEELNTRNLQLQKIANTIGEMESRMANIILERDELKLQISFYKNAHLEKPK